MTVFCFCKVQKILQRFGTSRLTAIFGSVCIQQTSNICDIVNELFHFGCSFSGVVLLRPQKAIVSKKDDNFLFINQRHNKSVQLICWDHLSEKYTQQKPTNYCTSHFPQNGPLQLCKTFQLANQLIPLLSPRPHSLPLANKTQCKRNTPFQTGLHLSTPRFSKSLHFFICHNI